MTRSELYNVSVKAMPVVEDDSVAKKKNVAIIGSGCAGLAAAYNLHRAGCKVTLFEKDGRLGGHANTIEVAGGVKVDTGFMVYNKLNYPNLCSLFSELDIKGIPTSMGFSVSMDGGKFEWCADSLAGLVATPGNLINPSFYQMMSDIARFNKLAKETLALRGSDAKKSVTVEHFLKEHAFSDSFTQHYLIPMTAAIWSSSAKTMLGFPLICLLTFLNNHMLLQMGDHIEWMTPANRSAEYVEKIRKIIGDANIRLNSCINTITRSAKGVVVTDTTGFKGSFDTIVFACHPDDALALLGTQASSQEREALALFTYSSNDCYVHSDESLMPLSRAAWTSWNYIGGAAIGAERPVFVTYYLNKLQSLKCDTNIFVSLNPPSPPSPNKTFSKIVYSHPQYSTDSMRGQKKIAELQGANNTYFCGAWMGFGFHEDGIRSGTEVSIAVSARAPSWVSDSGAALMIPASNSTFTNSPSYDSKTLLQRFITKPLLKGLQYIAKHAVFFFLRRGFKYGKLTFVLPRGAAPVIFSGEKRHEGDEVIVNVLNDNFFVRLAFEYDLGLSKAFIANEFSLAQTKFDYGGLTKFLLLLTDNTYKPVNKFEKKSAQSMAVKYLPTAALGDLVNSIHYRLVYDNSITNSRSNIHAHYDLSNDMFKTFLDEETMMYSCGFFKSTAFFSNAGAAADIALGISSRPGNEYLRSPVSFEGTLAEAQLRKIDTLLSRLEPITQDMTLLDIGFGWGGIAIRAAQKYGCKVRGITLSVEQKRLAEERVAAQGLQQLISFELCDYRVFALRGETFDRIVSCEMIEAVGFNYFGSFFEAVERLLKMDGAFVMQAITMPDSRYKTYLNSADFCNTIIFPGGCLPSLQALTTAAMDNSTLHVESITNHNLHYAETLRQWRYRFNAAFPKLVELGFDDSFIRLWNLYFCYCETGFQRSIINLQVITFRRPNSFINSNIVHIF